MWRAALAFLLLLPNVARAADPVFTGNLLLVAPGRISLRLADGRLLDMRLPKTGELSAASLATQYKLAEQVEVTGKHITMFLDEHANRFYSMEVKMLRSLRPASPEDLAKVAASISRESEGNLLRTPGAAARKPERKLPPVPDDVEHIRAVNLEYAAKMPNFMADETAKRFFGQGSPPKWRAQDTIESEITFQSGESTRQNIRINGKPYKSKAGWLPGINWGDGFGAEIKPLFEPDCENTFEREGREEVRGKQLEVYRYRAPQDGCFGDIFSGSERFNPARTGRILVEDPGGSVIQFEKEESGFPDRFGPVDLKETMSWDYVKIGDALHLLPVASDYLFTFAGGYTSHITVEYKNHRHFEASTNVTFK
jgi:hypothetical protein